MLRYTGMPADVAAGYRAGTPDAYGVAPERRTAEGGEPCRCCLGTIGAGEPLLLLAYRPFGALQPYAETGPVFLHAAHCERHDGALPEREQQSTGQRILRGYGADERIVYGTGVVVGADGIGAVAEAILASDAVAYVHMRSATNNCFTLRIDRA